MNGWGDDLKGWVCCTGVRNARERECGDGDRDLDRDEYDDRAVVARRADCGCSQVVDAIEAVEGKRHFKFVCAFPFKFLETDTTFDEADMILTTDLGDCKWVDAVK